MFYDNKDITFILQIFFIQLLHTFIIENLFQITQVALQLKWRSLETVTSLPTFSTPSLFLSLD